ncbi:CBS domain-containing protein [Parerythrobacter lacustris]|uniref:CBS domain-containing protein n=1 Tax=Parerythrobacter lacustris TaxID=2969984 RepID=A0ABT1XUA9_9SPHN|nr:CBS domain-containing protein [Parerythrobacter lacustris]MCR2834481.1 CBS domain-containing protein [Parerythrobacter lacustris]
MEIAQLIAGRASSEIVTADIAMSVRQVVAILAERRIGAIPVMDGGRVVGIFSERDVLYRLADQGAACLDQPVEQVMTAPPITVDRRTSTLEALGLMTRRRIRHLPVVDDGHMCGFVSIGDLVKSRMDEISHEAEALRDYIQTA